MRTWLLERGPVWRRAILLVLVGGLPLLFYRGTYDPINVPKLSLLFVGVTIVAALRIAEGLQGAGWAGLRRLLVPALAVAVPLLIAWVASSYKGWALFGLHTRFQGLIPYLVVIALGVLVADAFTGRVHQLVWALAISGGVVGAYALIQIAGADPFKWILNNEVTGTATSTLGNPNFTGGFLGIVLPVFVVLWFVSPERRALIAALGMLAAGGWIVAKSEGGWAGGLAGVTVAGGFVLAGRWSKARLVALGAAVLIAATMVGGVIYSAVNPEADIFSRTAELRGYWWGAAARMGADSPLVGGGPNAFAVEGVQYRPVEEAIATGLAFADDPHSVPLQLFAAAGILGVAGYLVTAGWATRTAAFLERSNLIGAAFAGCAAAYFVQSLVSIDELSLRATLWSVLGGLAAVAASGEQVTGQSVAARRRTRRRSRSRRVHEPLKAIPALVVLAAAVAGSVWWTSQFAIADARVKQGVQLFSRGSIREGMSEFEEALSFHENYFYRRIYGAQLARTATLQEETAEPLIPEIKGAFSYLQDFPDVSATILYARALGQAAAAADTSFEDALALYQRALALDPRNPQTRVETATVLQLMGRFDDAVEVLAPATDDVPTIGGGTRFAAFWGAVALARAYAGDEAGARDAIEIATSLDPDDMLAKLARDVLEE